MVIAGPGSGKTELLGLRVANILRQTDTDPRQILCLTFTDSAAVNMRKRLESLIGPAAYRVSINTFHTFGTWIIEHYREHFFGGAKLQPADELTQIELMTDIITKLDHNNPLRSYHPNSGYVYLDPALSAISDLKKAGLTPRDFSAIINELRDVYKLIEPLIDEVFANRISKKDLALFFNLNQKLKTLQSNYDPGASQFAMLEELISDYEEAIAQTQETDSTKPITAWKKANLKKANDMWQLKAWVGWDKLQALAEIYDVYLSNMYDQGYFDFDDMILESLVALRSNPDLKADIQEQFQYILVDEFQDTNEAQLEIIKHLTDGVSVNNRPNVMTVGDDDQAIYRFQGAEIGNLVNFTNHYDTVKTITLQKNYRSAPEIVSVARQTINQSNSKIEDYLPEVTKQITAFKEDSGKITRVELPSQAHEFSYVAQEIKRLIESGIEPANIAVIGRRHKTLESVVTYFQEYQLPTRYERQLNVLQETHIAQIITITRLLQSITDKDSERTDELLSEVIYYPFWNINELDVWRLSINAYQNKLTWLEAMITSDNKDLEGLATYLIQLAARSAYEPAEIIIDEIVGTSVSLVPDDPDAEPLESDNSKPVQDFYSGFKDYYFSAEKYEQSKSEYLSFLSSLRVFVAAIREYRQGKHIKINDLIRFVDIHEENEKLIADTSPFINATNAVNVLTAHKAKGMEFEVVFVLSCVQSEWVPRSRGNYFAWPQFLNIGVDADSSDDKLRLFYVAITRAISKLYFSSYSHTDAGKEVEPLEFLSGIEITNTDDIQVPSVADVLDSTLSARFKILPELEANSFLKDLLQNYKHSVTHLNNFIDVTKGGPEAFLEQNLLRFPHVKSASGSYGTAIHNTLDRAIQAKKVGTDLDLEAIHAIFIEQLTTERMSKADFELYSSKGIDELEIFYPWLANMITERDYSELNFASQGVYVNTCHLTGKIDWLHYNSSMNRYEIRDFKTGKPVDNWKGSTDWEKIKLHKYRQQLLFYKILIDNSRDYKGRFNPSCGYIDFVQPSNNKVISIEMEYEQSEIDQLTQLIRSVCNHIHTLDFPDISDYPESIKGVREFEKNLIEDIDK